VIGPVDVLEDEHDRRLCTEPGQQAQKHLEEMRSRGRLPGA
jgi:hypothetical protein